MDVALLIVGSVAAMLVALAAATRHATSIRRKGYNGPVFESLVVLVSLLAFLAVGGALFAYTADRILAARGFAEGGVAVGIAICLLASVASVGFTSVLVVSLPTRSLRSGGPRSVRFPYATLAKVCVAGAVLSPLGLIWSIAAWPRILQIETALIPAALGLFAMARRTRIPGAEQVLHEDSRRPVLYLRPFVTEENVFAELPWTWRGLLASGVQAYFRTFEEYVAIPLAADVGPLIALGNPEDYLPPEQGASRMYLSDQLWREQFSSLARRAACIVTVPNTSQNVAWELRRLRELECSEQLFVLTPPRWPNQSESGGPRNVLKRWPVFMMGRSASSPRTSWARSIGVRPTQWSAFAATLSDAGYVAHEYPGPGAVATFDATGELIVLARNAHEPQEFLAPIRQHLEQHARSEPTLYHTAASLRGD
jgi:hypothetical protein